MLTRIVTYRIVHVPNSRNKTVVYRVSFVYQVNWNVRSSSFVYNYCAISIFWIVFVYFHPLFGDSLHSINTVWSVFL